jgi:hypothetical protein
VPFAKQWLAFEPEAVKAMTLAFDEVVDGLRLAGKDDPVRYVVAKKILEFARRGESDPARLAALALHDLRRQGSGASRP